MMLVGTEAMDVRCVQLNIINRLHVAVCIHRKELFCVAGGQSTRTFRRAARALRATPAKRHLSNRETFFLKSTFFSSARLCLFCRSPSWRR